MNPPTHTSAAPTTAALVALTLGVVLAACTVTPNPVVPDEENITVPIEQAGSVAQQAKLDQAMRAAMAYFAETGDMTGFAPQTAAGIEPSIRYNTSPSAIVDEVSIRVVSPTAVVLATRDGSGAVMCRSYDGASGATTSGSTDAASVEECA